MGDIWQQAAETPPFTSGIQPPGNVSENGAPELTLARVSITRATSWLPPGGTAICVCGSFREAGNWLKLLRAAASCVLARTTVGWLLPIGMGLVWTSLK